MAYEASTLPQIRQEVGKRLGLIMVIPTAFTDAFAAGSFTSSNYLRNSNYGTGYFSELDTLAFRPLAATSADYIRPVGDLINTSGLLAHTGANWSASKETNGFVELWYHNIRPDIDFIDCLNRVMKMQMIKTIHDLSHGSELDYGFELASTDTNWTDVLTPTTSAKGSVARRTPYGRFSYRLVNNAANEGSQSATLPMGSSRVASAFAISSADVGTASFQPYDVTNSTTTGMPDAVTHSQESPQLMCITSFTVPSTCTEIALQLLGTTSTSDIYWNKTWLYKHDELFIRFPSYISERFKAASIFQGVPMYSTANNVYDALSLDMVELHEGRDYFLHFNHGDANPYGVRFASNVYYNNPLFVELQRPAADYTTFAADETATTNAPFNELVPRVCLDMIDRVMTPRGIMLDKLPALRARAQKDLDEATEARPSVSIAKEYPYFSMRSV